jgi:hypothetical protein
MQKFTDSTGRVRTVAITVATLRRLKAAGIDLCDLQGGEPPLIMQLAEDATQVAAALAVILEVEQASLDACLDAASFAAAYEAFWKELADFFRPWRTATAVMIQDMTTAERIAATPPQGPAEASGSASGGSPASAGATPPA